MSKPVDPDLATLPYSQLDPGQVIKQSYSEADRRIRVTTEIQAFNIDGQQEVSIDQSDDSIQIYGTDGTTHRAIKTDTDGNLTVAATVIGSADVNIHDSNGNDISTTGTSLDVNVTASALPSGAATSDNQTNGTQQTKITDGTDIALVTAAGELNVLSTAQPGVDIGDVTVNNGAGVSAVNIQDGGNSITVDGTVTAMQGTSPWVDNITQFGSNAVVTGTGNGGLGIPRVTVSNDSSITNITGTISLPTGAATESTLSTLNGKVNNDYGVSTGAIRTASQIGNTTGAANFNAGTTGAQTLRTSANITKNGTELNYGDGATSTETLRTSSNIKIDGTTPNTNFGTVGANTLRNASIPGNATGIADFNAGTTGAQTPRITSNITRNGTELSYNSGVADANTLRVSLISNQQFSPSTYAACASSFTAATNPTDVFTIVGSGTKTIYLKKITISGTNSSNTNAVFDIVKRSSANTGGTSSTATLVPLDSTFAAATVTVLSYTANPTLGTTVGTIRNGVTFFPSLGGALGGQIQILEFSTNFISPIVLRGTSEAVSVNFRGATLGATTLLTISIEWIEV